MRKWCEKLEIKKCWWQSCNDGDRDDIELLDKTRDERDETREEMVINREIPITYASEGYRTRSKGAVPHEKWVMKKAL